MKKIVKNAFFPSAVLYVLFIVLTVLLYLVDVKPIGPAETSVGFATVNGFVFQKLGTNILWYQITKWLGYLAIVYMVGFAVYGYIQWLDRKKLRRVDSDLLLLGGFYILVALFYVLFEIVIVNFRPVIVEGAIEASYPSSHTMLVVCVMTTGAYQFFIRFKNVIVKWVTAVLSLAIAMITVAGRLLAGVHWITDIIGGLLLSAALIMLYFALVKTVKKKRRKK